MIGDDELAELEAAAKAVSDGTTSAAAFIGDTKRFAARAHPAAVLALLARVRAAEGGVRERDGLITQLWKQIEEDKEDRDRLAARVAELEGASHPADSATESP